MTERAAKTIAKLLQSTIDAIVDVGVSGATVREISRRAGVSQGALFRHFAGRDDLLLAAIDEMHRRHLAQLEVIARQAERPVDVRWLEEVRSRARQPEALAWIDLLVAARTDPKLRRRVSAHLRRLDAELVELAVLHPALAELTPAHRRLWVTIARRVVQGGALVDLGRVEPRPSEPKLRALVALHHLLATSPSAPG